MHIEAGGAITPVVTDRDLLGAPPAFKVVRGSFRNDQGEDYAIAFRDGQVELTLGPDYRSADRTLVALEGISISDLATGYLNSNDSSTFKDLVIGADGHHGAVYVVLNGTGF